MGNGRSLDTITITRENEYYDGPWCRDRILFPSRWHENGANTFYAIGALILWDINLGYDHGEMRWMSIDHSVVPWLALKLVILSLMFHDGLHANASARVEDI